jgi:hypothetical protein
MTSAVQRANTVNTSGSTNIGLGYTAGAAITTGNNSDIGNQGTAYDSGIIRIGTLGTHTTTCWSKFPPCLLPNGATKWKAMAQDFHEAFGLNGIDDKHIATMDEGGVALAAMQGLNEKVESGKWKAGWKDLKPRTRS